MSKATSTDNNDNDTPDVLSASDEGDVAELLKTLGWQYLMLNGAFRRYASHAAAFQAFTERVEDTLNEDVEGYLGTMAGDSPDGGKRHEVVV